MISLTKRQHNVLCFIAGYIENNGRAPTYREIAAGCGVQSASAAHKVVMRLAERGTVFAQGGIRLTASVPIPRAPKGEPLFFVPAPEARP
ncbi:MAG: LexA family protein [Erythrobacter sp.]